MVLDDNEDPVPLYEFIAREVCKKRDIEYEGQTIGELALAYPNDNIPATCNSIYNKIDADKFFMEPLQKLAEIGDFKFFISTTLDDMLVKALRKSRNLKKKEMNILNYSLQQFSDMDFDDDDDDDEKEPKTTVFKILGNFDNVTESAFNEEEMLEHFLSITSKFNRHPMADYFIKQVKNKILLFIGCDFPDWFMRFIIRILTNQRYKYRNFNDYIVPHIDESKKNLTQFLNQFNKNVVVLDSPKEGNVRGFVNQMHEKYLEAMETRPIQYEGTVFLSYNHRDVEAVEKFKKLLRAKGIRNTWFDLDDLPSGEHRSSIEEEIRQCSVFVPIISENSLGHPESYTWQVEWKAIEMRMTADKFYGKMSFQMIPCIADQTERGDKRIPDYMQAFAVWELEEHKERVAEEIIKHLTPL
jgi:hypothetical protein